MDETIELLKDLQNALNMIPNQKFPDRKGETTTSYSLAARLDDYLKELEVK